MISSALVNEFRVGFSRDNSFAEQDPFGLNHTADYVPGVPENPAFDGGVPLTTFTGFNTFIGSPNFLPKFQITQQYQFSDTLSWNLGKHQFKSASMYTRRCATTSWMFPARAGTIGFDKIFTCQRNAANQCVSGTGISYADGLLGYVAECAAFQRRLRRPAATHVLVLRAGRFQGDARSLR